MIIVIISSYLFHNFIFRETGRIKANVNSPFNFIVTNLK